MKIAIVGAGSWGTALAHALATDGTREVALWARDAGVAEVVSRTRHNPAYLTDLSLDERVTVSAELATTVDAADVVILAVPTDAMAQVVSRLLHALPPTAIVVSAAKGFDAEHDLTMTAMLREMLGPDSAGRIAALSGPNIAVEIGRGLPAATVVAGEEACANAVRDACTGPRLRVYSTTDCIGVEYAGALKNIVGIAAGACDGMGAGDNGKAAIMTRGLAEIARLGLAAGARVLTFAGLAGLGDCVVTCMSPYSRNRRFGELIARGASLDGAVAEIAMAVEGVNATRVAARLAHRYDVDMPITREVHAVLFEGKPISEAMTDLMSRDPADEVH
ncbi:MAG TPA: NAD(P)H-dependent glycerol-3-phosphate dehydrogenase [Candidatus Dormibacteraeota bacterium]